MSRYCFDLDETLCTGYPYELAQPLPKSKWLLHTLRSAGHVVIIQTARGMGSTGGSVGKAQAAWAALTFQQLQEWGFEFDEIYFGKPAADFYVDDKMVDLGTLVVLAGELHGRSECNSLQD